MTVREYVSLRELTTFKVGGLARYVLTCDSIADVQEALTFIREKNLSFRVLGSGSNVLARDEVYEGAILLMRIPGIRIVEKDDAIDITFGAGVLWEDAVSFVAEQGWWGIENLAGIPGTVGAAPVQNIGAYGAELKQLFVSVTVLNSLSGELSVYDAAACQFGYRDSIFKHNQHLIICEVTLRVTRTGEPRLGYGDLAQAVTEGTDMTTPARIAKAVREIRSHKFPDLSIYGTAGSFFKNPIITHEAFASLTEKYGALPSFPAVSGIKIPLAFILDKILHLRGYREGNVYLFGNQPLVLVAEQHETFDHINDFANTIAEKVFVETNISIEREVQTP